jgi:hypothetical protein
MISMLIVPAPAGPLFEKSAQLRLEAPLRARSPGSELITFRA